ncbi:aldo/keto reductase [Microbacterium sp. P5_E9]
MGLGTAQLGDLYRPLTAQDCVDIVDTAWSEGIRYFDTAPLYGFGLAERRLGDALRTYPRSEYTLSSKVGRILTDREAEPHFRWDFSAEGVRASLDTSLYRLGTTHIDLVLIHDPQEHLDWALNEALPALEALRDNGEVGAIGVGSGSIEALVAFAETGCVDALMVAGRYTLLEHPAAERLLPLCDANGISVINVGVFNSGLLAADEPRRDSHYEYQAVPHEQLARARELAVAAGLFDTTLPQAALAFAAAPVAVASVVVGAESADQVARNAELFQSRQRAASMLQHLRETS